MCWSETATWSMVGIGSVATAIAWYREEPPAIWGTIAFFTMMEALQVWGYRVIDQCGAAPNAAVTLVSYLHICLQPLVINIFCMALVSPSVTPRMRSVVLGLSGLASLTLLARLIPAPWLGICPPELPLCGTELCTISGSWHLGWTVPLNNLFSLQAWFGAMGQFPDYMLAAFLLPCLYGAWRFALFNGAMGPVLSSIVTTDPHEMPAVWCFFSVGIVILGLSPAFRQRLQGHGGITA